MIVEPNTIGMNEKGGNNRRLDKLKISFNNYCKIWIYFFYC